MDYRSLRISTLFAATGFFAIFNMPANAAPAAQSCAPPQVFRIVAPSSSAVVTQDVAGGVLVTDVVGSPLRRGDVIVAVNGNPVRCQNEFNIQLSDIRPGETFSVDVVRDGQIQTVILQRPPEQLAPPLSTVEIRGITATSLPTEFGVVVEDTLIGTPASDAGIKPGDIILDVDGHEIHSAEQFLALMRQLTDQSATFNILQRNGQVNVFVIPS